MPCRTSRRLLTVEQVLTWADAHQARTGRWPTVLCGAILEQPGTTWRQVDEALRYGHRGLPGEDSLALLLRRSRGKRTGKVSPLLTAERILTWADAWQQRTGRWPKWNSGAVADAPGENWRAINLALHKGHRGLPGGDSLARLLRRHQRLGFGLLGGEGGQTAAS